MVRVSYGTETMSAVLSVSVYRRRVVSGRAKSAVLFFFNDPATTEINTRAYTLSLHGALPI